MPGPPSKEPEWSASSPEKMRHIEELVKTARQGLDHMEAKTKPALPVAVMVFLREKPPPRAPIGNQCKAEAVREDFWPIGPIGGGSPEDRCDLVVGHDGPHQKVFGREFPLHRWRAYRWETTPGEPRREPPDPGLSDLRRRADELSWRDGEGEVDG